MKVVTFNLLAQSKIKRIMFPRALHDTLKWHYRREKLRQIIGAFQADLLALQEVDFFDTHWSAFLADTCGYHGRFARKPKNSINNSNNYDNDNNIGDGLYTGWNPDIIQLVEYDTICMSTLMDELMERGAHPNIAQMFVFKECKSENLFCFVNTHLYWAPGFDALRRNQLALIVAVYKQKYDGIPLILSGDLNSDIDSPACRFLRGQCGFVSACNKLPFTVCTMDIFVDTLDYIWLYPGDRFEHEECELVDISEAVSSREGGIPSLAHPSDHLPIGANIAIL